MKNTKKWLALAALALAAGCSDARQPLASAPAAPRQSVWGVDNDHDGIDDGTEDELANLYAPLLYMPNLITRTDASTYWFFGTSGDWTRPANVEWYLARTRLGFHHGGACGDDFPFIYYPTLSQLLSQQHQGMTAWPYCEHTSTIYNSAGSSYSEGDHFFLQIVDDEATDPGISDPGQWKVYTHVYRNTLGGYSLQYWFFYAYDDWASGANHEGDWEHITVVLNAQGQVSRVWMGQHTAEEGYYPHELTWLGGTHPEVWVADGSHASYGSEYACDNANQGPDENCWTNYSQRWFTWAGGQGYLYAGMQGGGLVNVGEVDTSPTGRHPMPGQEWMMFSGRWGEQGNTVYTSGPRSPAYQDSWTRDMAAPTSFGTAGPGDCPATSGPSPHQITDVQPDC